MFRGKRGTYVITCRNIGEEHIVHCITLPWALVEFKRLSKTWPRVTLTRIRTQIQDLMEETA